MTQEDSSVFINYHQTFLSDIAKAQYLFSITITELTYQSNLLTPDTVIAPRYS